MAYFFSPSKMAFYCDEVVDVIPEDCIKLTDEQHAQLFKDMSKGLELYVDGDQVKTRTPTIVLPQEQINEVYERRVINMLNAQAVALRYSSITSAVTYAGDPNPQYNAEGTALRNWRSKVYETFYLSLASNPPTSILESDVEAFLATLPKFEAP